MAFNTEPVGYEKTLLSDLQGSWQSLRDAVVEHAGFTGWERVLLHIDEGKPLHRHLLPIKQKRLSGRQVIR